MLVVVVVVVVVIMVMVVFPDIVLPYVLPGRVMVVVVGDQMVLWWRL